MCDDFGGSSGGCDTSDTGPSWSSSDHNTGHSFSSATHHDSGHSWSTSDHHHSGVSHSSYSDHSHNSSSPSHHSTLSSADDHGNHAASTLSRTAHSHVTSKSSTCDYIVPDISRVGINDGDLPEVSPSKRKDGPVLEHGFSFGERSVSFEPASSSGPTEDDEGDDGEEEDEDEGIGEIYGTEGKELLYSSSVESSPIYKPSPIANKRQVISKPIGKVGHIGQNIGLGHQIGVLVEDIELRPKPVELESAEYILDDDSPMQVDIKWSKPGNADRLRNLTYEVEMKPQSPSDAWVSVASVKFPVFRIYHTDDKLLVGKMHFSRQLYDLSYTFRVRCQGDVSPQTGVSLTLTSDWSKDITVTFLGYETKHNTVQTTCL